MKAVFDIDDTLCVAESRDYPNAQRISDIVDKLNHLHDDLGYEIELYTSRGMVSCNGNVQAADKKNRAVLEKWLEDNDVHYDKLTFGKPIADLYVDDKAMGLDEFRVSRFANVTSGGSKGSVVISGRFVKKTFESHEECVAFKKWCELAGFHSVCIKHGTVRRPKVHSYLYDSVYMDYIDGKRLCDNTDMPAAKDLIIYVLNVFRQEKGKDVCDFDIEKQIAVLNYNRVDEKASKVIDECIENLRKFDFSKDGSFCHGDLTFANAIVRNDKRIFIIDPRYIEGSNSYLIDLAKIKMSLAGYERKFGIGNACYGNEFVKEFNELLRKNEIYSKVYWLSVMSVLRLLRYKGIENRRKVYELLEVLRNEYPEAWRN